MMKKSFLPYINREKIEENGVFFIGLSHKCDKQKNILDAFCLSTISGKIIHAIKDRSNTKIYLTNLVKGVPLDQNGKIRYPSEQEKQIGLKELKSKIFRYKPKKVFCFGKQVSNIFINDSEIKKNNKNMYEFYNTKLIFVDHPSYISIYKRDYIEQYIQNILSLIKANKI